MSKSPTGRVWGWAGKASGLIWLVALAACASVTDPQPSRLFDGRYVGTRWSDKPLACGVTRQRGTTMARIVAGEVSLPLFGPATRMEGTVGADGAVRASGLWRNPDGGFPRMTVLTGKIGHGDLQGLATDQHCHTEIHLRKATPLPERHRSQPRPDRDLRS